jgi:2-amino-4-hydroxy-6-hydroxymethyldihydropteridine diphosphokinase
MSKPGMPVRAYVGLGGNVGVAEDTLRAAIRALDALPSTRLVRASRLYRTPAWGRVEQPDFVNAVAAIDTALAPRALLDSLLGIERAHGRERDAEARRWGPRTLDLDLLLYGDASIDEPGLHVPHPHLHERAFVLVPLCEIAPEVVIRGHGTAREVRRRVIDENIRAIG